jgi:hypothetical protein
MVEGLLPASVCLADGELRVDLEPAVDFEERHASPVARPDTPIPFSDEIFAEAPIIEPVPPIVTQKRGFIPFSGVGRRLND